MDMSGEFDRIMFFEHARKAAEASYAKDPRDVDNLTRWGSALLELSSFQQPAEAKRMIQDAISKLEEALEVEPKKPETLWCLGNALTSLAFLFSDADEAGNFFKQAGEYFTKACEEDPSNELFRKSLEIAAKAPELHAEFHKGGFAQQLQQAEAPAAAGSSASASTRTTTKKKKSSDLKYDIMGWVILAVGIVTWVGFAAKNSMPPPPPPPQPR